MHYKCIIYLYIKILYIQNLKLTPLPPPGAVPNNVKKKLNLVENLIGILYSSGKKENHVSAIFEIQIHYRAIELSSFFTKTPCIVLMETDTCNLRGSSYIAEMRTIFAMRLLRVVIKK